jgi:predicted nucleic acid-binding protein
MSKEKRTLADTEIQIAIAELAYVAENAAEQLTQEKGDNIYSHAINAKLEALELMLRKYNQLDVLRDLL